MQRVKNKLKELDLKKLEGSKIRSRVILLESKEQPSKFFYRKEMSKGKKKLISKIGADKMLLSGFQEKKMRSFKIFLIAFKRIQAVIIGNVIKFLF